MKKFNDLPINSLSHLPLTGLFKEVYVPENLYEFVSLMTHFDKRKIEYLVFGKGTNILPIRSYIKTPIILYKEKILTINDKQIIVSGNYNSFSVGKSCNELGFTNFIGVETIPGTIGAGIKNNASFLDRDCLNGLKYLFIYRDGKTYFKSIDDFSFSYRKSNIDGIILFAIYEGIKEDINIVRKYYFDIRKNQPSGISLGSTFLNPKKGKAYEYIIGIKDKLKFIDVEFSSKHANFLSFNNITSPENVFALINETRRLVFEKYGVKLELEIKLIK